MIRLYFPQLHWIKMSLYMITMIIKDKPIKTLYVYIIYIYIYIYNIYIYNIYIYIHMIMLLSCNTLVYRQKSWMSNGPRNNVSP